MVLGVDHISINTRDFETSARFYTEVLGFRRLETVPMDGGFSITYFEVPGGLRMESGVTLEYCRLIPGGTDHV